MHSCDVIAYTVDGACYCDECGEQYDDGGENTDCSPVFADSESEIFGLTCDDCGNCYVVGYGWMDHESAVDPSYVRWATCKCCNSQTPYDKDASDYRDDRQAALCGRLVCRNCMKPTVHF